MTGALAEWSEFNVAMAGASAALAGLVIVAASVNIDKIIRARTLTAPTGARLSRRSRWLSQHPPSPSCPGIDLTWYGIILLFSTLMAGVFTTHATRSIVVSDPDPERGARRICEIGARVLADRRVRRGGGRADRREFERTRRRRRGTPAC